MFEQILTVLNLLTIVTALIIGLAMGTAMVWSSHRMTTIHLYWMVAGGTVFFVPVAITRYYLGTPTWEHVLGTYVLWVVYAIGMWASARFLKDRRP